MPWKALVEKLRSLIKDHKQQCPILLILFLSWHVLPLICKVMVLAFALLLFFYDVKGWRYTQWKSEDASPDQRKVAKIFHYTLLSLLIIPPMACVAVFESQHLFPNWIDRAVLSTVADSTITNDVPRYVFTVGSPQPTNTLVSYIGIANPSGANLFQTGAMFRHATSGLVTFTKDFGAITLFIGFLLFLGLMGYETLVESKPNNAPELTDRN